MSVRRDPTGAERRALLSFAGDFNGKRVLEVGCGDGRLTWQYADIAGHVMAIDPDEVRIQQARQALPPELRSRVSFSTTDLEEIDSPVRFDLAILAWSL